jgi:hypothetical protein
LRVPQNRPWRISPSHIRLSMPYKPAVRPINPRRDRVSLRSQKSPSRHGCRPLLRPDMSQLIPECDPSRRRKQTVTCSMCWGADGLGPYCASHGQKPKGLGGSRWAPETRGMEPQPSLMNRSIGFGEKANFYPVHGPGGTYCELGPGGRGCLANQAGNSPGQIMIVPMMVVLGYRFVAEIPRAGFSD